MRTRIILLIATFSLAFAAANAAPKPLPAAADPLGPPALVGQVTSQEEGAMEGVVVSAKKDGSTITVSVISDNKGHFSFPASRLEPGHYTLKIRAVGYNLEAPATADLAAQKATTADLKLVKAKNMIPQMTNAEWIMSMPGTDEQKDFLMNCVSCHTLQRIVTSTHDADEFTQVITRMMGYAQVSQPIKPQRRVEANRGGDPEQYRKNAEFLSSVNLSSVAQWEYPGSGHVLGVSHRSWPSRAVAGGMDRKAREHRETPVRRARSRLKIYGIPLVARPPFPVRVYGRFPVLSDGGGVLLLRGRVPAEGTSRARP